ncbi:MAG: protein kinase [Rhodospirillales bacterium]|nr:protein kinase [Rhodospirillales bacterium]
MTELSGYILESLQNGSEFALYRGRQPGNAVPILVVAPAAAQQTPANRGRLEHELSLADKLDSAWAVRPVALARHEGRTVLVLEDPGGDPVGATIGRPLELARFLQVAIGLAIALGQVHRHGLIHKDIKPANLLVDAAGNVRLTGFGIASRLPRERQAPAPPEVIAGTFAYMAPEQTGRMNRSIDARSDLYSLGVTLYEMLTGALPFTASDPMEWVHCHIARQPMPPSERLDGIPGPVAAIVLKLLAKTAEHRYQTAAGVEADLRQCQAAWRERRRIDPFPLAAHDLSDRLLIPERLYGREDELAALVAAFDRVASRGTTELVLVSGYAGIGKSSIVNELHKMLVPPRGLFAAGKFDQYKRDIPYATVAQAFRNLVCELLSKNDAELDSWRKALLEALGANGRLMVNLMPELALVVGEQPPVPDLPPHDAQSRFQVIFRRFLGVFARPEHPLALFLDDLQWLDSATLDLLGRLATDPELKHLLLVCAYRDSEVGPAHPLTRALKTIRDAGTRVENIALLPLGLDDLTQLVADSLRAERVHVHRLAELVFRRTAGNPFFAIQFLTALAEEELLTFDPDARAWRWDLDRIRAKGSTDNVVDLVAGKLNRLPGAALEVLKELACLGNNAQTATLSTVLALSEEEIHAALWHVVRAGLVFRQDGAYVFLHDRVQEAAYALIPDGERARAHLHIGRVLASRTAPSDLEEKIFEITNQLDRGAALIRSPEERRKVAELNLAAGRRARTSTAYASALAYLMAGRALLSESSWDDHYRLTFDLEFHRAECEFLTGELAAAAERLSALAGRAANLVDAAAVARLRLALYTTLDRSDLAVEVGLDYLRHVGIDWSPHPRSEDVREECDRMWLLLDGRSADELRNLPVMSDTVWRATMDVLVDINPPASFTDPNLRDLVLLRMTNLSLEHGNCDGSCYAYVSLNIVLGVRYGDYRAGLSFGKLGFDLVEGLGLPRFKARVQMNFASMVLPWTNSLHASQALMRLALETATASGDLTYLLYSRRNLVTNLLVSGTPLGEVQHEAEEGLACAQKARFGLVIEALLAQIMLIRGLRAPGAVDEAAHDDASFERHLGEDPYRPIAAFAYWTYKLQLGVFAEDYASAVAAAEKAMGLLWSARSFLEVAEYHFYAALARAGVCSSLPTDSQRQHRDALREHQEQIAIWAANCPENFANRAFLVGAEVARLEGRELDAERLYEEAIRSAHEYGFAQNEGLGNELAARFHAGRGFRTIADAYLRNARSCYLRWGADGKVARLDESHPQLRIEPWSGRVGDTGGTPVEHLDLATVVKVSQAVSGEIDLRKLIDTLMVIALEHAGGERGLLLLPRGDEMLIEAEAMTVGEAVEVRLRQAPATAAELPESILRYVARTHDSLLLDDASEQNPFTGDDYIRRNRCRSLLCLPLIKQAKLIGVLYLENRLASHVFTPARTAVLRLLASQAAISLENARLYGDLQHAEGFLAEAQRLSHTGSFVFDTSSGAVSWSDEIFRIYEFDCAVKPTLGKIFERIHPDDIGRVQEFVARTPHDGREHDLEHRIVMSDGSVKFLRIVAHSVTDQSGAVELVGTAIDVTASKQAQERLQSSLEEKEALLKEVHHRVKNNLQLISSLLNLQAARIADRSVAELFAESRNRVRSMALVHENLYRAGNFVRIPMRDHIQSLCAHLIRAYGLHGHHVELATEVDDVQLNLDRAVSAGLIINELVSNAFKHAFPDDRSGCIRVALTLRDEGRCMLLVRDDGVGLPPELDVGRAGSLGLQLVRDLTEQLHGILAVRRDGGTIFTITFDADLRAEAKR